jgi:hypothetical protein
MSTTWRSAASISSASSEPKVIYEIKATKTVSEIPHVYVKQMLDALYQRKPGSRRRCEPPRPKRTGRTIRTWSRAAISRARPAACPKAGPVAGQQREPLGGLVRWTAETANLKNHLIRFTFDANVGDNEGVMYYSQPFPVEALAKYRFQCRWRTNGPAVKVFNAL